MCTTLIIGTVALAMGGMAEPVPRAQQLQTVVEDAGSTVDNRTQTDEVALGRDQADRMTVAVSVAGQGPYRFLVDTGSERTVISRQLANRLQLKKGPDAVLHSVIGHGQVSTVHIPQLKISANSISVSGAPALEASNIGADGMLGIDSLRSQRVLFDFKAGTMAITPAASVAPSMEGDTIVVRARTRNGRLVFTDAEIEGVKVVVVIDTGSQVTIGNLPLLRRLSRRGAIRENQTMTIESVTGQSMEANVARLPVLQLGGVKLAELAVAFTDAHIFDQLKLGERPALLLGMNAMRAFDKISIDFTSRKVRFVLPGTSMRGTIRLAGLMAR